MFRQLGEEVAQKLAAVARRDRPGAVHHGLAATTQGMLVAQLHFDGGRLDRGRLLGVVGVDRSAVRVRPDQEPWIAAFGPRTDYWR